MELSIIIPVYNTEKYLSACIDSVINQTFTDWELILIDDGSPDNAGKICDEYSAKNSKIKVFHTVNSGVSAARNLGIKNAKGDYVAFIDSDDTILPDMYSDLLSVAKKYDVEIVTSDFITGGKTTRNSLPENEVINREKIESSVLPQFTFAGSIGTFAFTNKIIKRSLLLRGKCEFPKGFSFQEDLMFMITVYAAAQSLYYLPKAYYIYEPNETGLYSSYRENGGEKFIEARKKIDGFIKEYNIQNLDQTNFDLAFLYNVSFFVYRTLNRIKGKKKNEIIKSTLTNQTVKSVSDNLKVNATSFDRRIASAISAGKIKKAIFLIKFVYSGKAEKIQKLIAKLRGERK